MAEKNRFEPWLAMEIFVLLNLGFLTFDIYLAHSVNDFRSRAEYIPLFFSATAPILLLVGLAAPQPMARSIKVPGYIRGDPDRVDGCVAPFGQRFFYERAIPQPGLLGAFCRST